MTQLKLCPRERFRLGSVSNVLIDEARRALLVLGAVAAEDADYAKNRNGRGFSRSDSNRGHTLSKVSLAAALGDHSLLDEILRMAARYKRQASILIARHFALTHVKLRISDSSWHSGFRKRIGPANIHKSAAAKALQQI